VRPELDLPVLAQLDVPVPSPDDEKSAAGDRGEGNHAGDYRESYR